MMLATGWNKLSENRSLFNYYLVMPFSNDEKAHANRFKYLGTSTGLALVGIYMHPIAFVYPIILGAMILKEWLTTPVAMRIQQTPHVRVVREVVERYVLESDGPEDEPRAEDPERASMRNQVANLMKQNAAHVKEITQLKKEIEELKSQSTAHPCKTNAAVGSGQD